jgi:hypothetical protein
MGRSCRGQSLKPVMFRNATSSAPSSKYLAAAAAAEAAAAAVLNNTNLALTGGAAQ